MNSNFERLRNLKIKHMLKISAVCLKKSWISPFIYLRISYSVSPFRINQFFLLAFEFYLHFCVCKSKCIMPYRANLNISKKSWFLRFKYHSIKCPGSVSIGISLHKIFKNCFLLSKFCFKMFTLIEVLLLSKFGSERGDFDWCKFWASWVCALMLWCCDSRSQDLFYFIRIGSGHPVIWSLNFFRWR